MGYTPVWYKQCGFHSVLIYDHEPKCNAYRVSGLRWLTRYGWIFNENLNKIMVKTPQQTGWRTRKYRR